MKECRNAEMRIRQHIALVLAMSAGTAVAVAQLLKEEPADGTAVKVQEQSKNGQMKLLVASIQDIELTEEQEAPAGVVAERPDCVK
jgi:hypothetical protein